MIYGVVINGVEQCVVSLSKGSVKARADRLGYKGVGADIYVAKVYKDRAAKHQETVQAPYKELGLHSSTATIENVKAAYRRLSLIHHPDKKGDPAVFRRITDTYRRLKKHWDVAMPIEERRRKRPIKGALKSGD